MAKPFIRCPGGKRQLLPAITELLPRTLKHYYEPFIGGGAVFFALQDRGLVTSAYLSDVDEDLIELYKAVRDDPKALHDRLQALSSLTKTEAETKATYYAMRAAWNAGAKSPAVNLFLRSSAFNGIWRVNGKGEMNTPWRKTLPRLPSLVELQSVSIALSQASLRSESFAVCFPREGDFVYADPPYLGGWTSYTKFGWAREDAIAFLAQIGIWANVGAQVMVSHSDTPEFRALLAEYWPAGKLRVVQAKRAINSDGKGRGSVPELLITSY